ncbi:MAG: hypothetical protein ACJ71Q_02420 [Terriglobales bacterium]
MSRRIQIIILVFVALAAIRIFLIYRERHAPAPAPKVVANPNFSADDYVVPTQVHAYDLKSAKEALDGKTIWVKAGNQVYYYPYAGARPDFKHPVGLLPPLRKLDVTNVITATAPGGKGEEIAPGVRVREEQVLAIFRARDDTKMYAAPIGQKRGGDYTLYINDTFFFEDPHQLYKHWTSDMWTAIDQHQPKQGMNELQASMSLGAGVPQGSGGEFGNRTLLYDNSGHPVKITFVRNHATTIENVTGS